MFETLRIGFHADGPSFDGDTLRSRALGGSETALIQAAKALAARGHQVTVFNNCRHPGIFDGVTYLNSAGYVYRLLDQSYDVFVVSRSFGFFRLPIPAALKVLWNHDTLDQPAMLREVADRVDLYFTLSSFHRDHFLTRIPDLDGRIQVTRNGIDLELIDRSMEGAARDPAKVMYVSRPERGLKVLLEDIWPRLLARRPELTLYLCGYEVDAADLAPGLDRLYRELDDLVCASERVVRLGALPKPEYYRHLAEASLLLYPCTFPEISCIAALEAQACGTPVVTSDAFALSETVLTPETRIAGRPGSRAYCNAFVDTARHLIETPERRQALADRARRSVRARHGWETITAEWERLFRLALRSGLSARNQAGTGHQAEP